MGPEVVVGIITAIAAVLSAIIMATSGHFGWQRAVLRDIDVFEKLYPLVNSGREEVNLDVFRSRIFRRLEKGMFRPYKKIRVFCFYSVGYFVLYIFVCLAFGRSYEEISIIYDLCCSLVYGVAMTAIVWLLGFGPKWKINYVYQNAERAREANKMFDDIFKALEEDHRREGWVSNFYLYEQSKRAEWGYRATAESDDGCQGNVDNREDAEEAHDELHDYLQDGASR